MTEQYFQGILIDKTDAGSVAKHTQIAIDQLPEGDVEIDVLYSSMNYKDALAITGSAPVVRKFPMVPGIDLVGTVRSSSHPDYQAGDKVLLNGFGVGEGHWGGLAQRARLKGDWLVPLPEAFSPEQAMAIGTAGYTAMLCVQALERHGITPERGEILVTGAAGGVGSVAVSLLAKRGYKVVALSGRAEQEQAFLTALGATEVMPREQLEGPGKPLSRERWAGVVDVVGSHVLANACASTQYGGVVTACGLAGGMDLPATVAPFILRGVTLAGIDSVMCPREPRIAAWRQLAEELDTQALAGIAKTIGLGEVLDCAEQLMAGEIRGRCLVDVNR